jgi:hypothetical protein
MQARIVMTNGAQFIVDDVDSRRLAMSLEPSQTERFATIEVAEGGTTRFVHVFPENVAYVEDVVERRSAYEERGVVSG